MDAYVPFVDPIAAAVLALVICLAVGIFAWKRHSVKATTAWTELVDYESAGRHPYRNAPQIVKVERLYGFVRAASIANSALWLGIVWCFIVTVVSWYNRDFRVAILALGLACISLFTAHHAERLSLGGPDELPAVRGRILAGASISLLAYGAIGLTFVALARGKLDGLSFDPSWFEFSLTAPRLPVFISRHGGPAVLFQPHVLVSMVLTCWGLVHAGIWLTTMLVMHERLAKSDTRFRASFGASLLVILAGLVSVVVTLEGMPARIERMATDVYKSIERPCMLPPLPESATEVGADQNIAFISEREIVHFTLQHPTAYKHSLRETWYDGEKPSEPNMQESLDPPQWSEEVDHYTHHWTDGREHATTCNVIFDRNQHVVHIEMSAE